MGKGSPKRTERCQCSNTLKPALRTENSQTLTTERLYAGVRGEIFKRVRPQECEQPRVLIVGTFINDTMVALTLCRICG